MKKHIAIPITIILALTLSLSILITALADPWPDRNLEFGMTGDDVLSLQMALEEEGFATGDQEGYFGTPTQNALMIYQSVYGLIPDGIAGPQTFTVLYGESDDQTQAEASSEEISGSVPSGSLVRGMSGSEVTGLQRLLNSLGYYNGPLDGDFGSVTESAVLAFQSDNGLYADGIAGPVTLNALNSGAPAQQAQTQVQTQTQAASDAAASFDRSLSRGMTGSDVTALQNILHQLGYYSAAIDGDFGSVTEAAVLAFQSDKGLYADGIAGPITLNALNSGAPAQQAQTQTQTQTQTASNAAASFDRSLSRGMTGSDVTALQNILHQLGYYSAAIDGDFGSVTEAAVLAFQQAKGLVADGIAGPVTFGELQGLTNTRPAAAAQDEEKTEEEETEEEDKGTPASEAVVLTNISNAPGGIEIDWAKVEGINTYRVFRLDDSGSWRAIGDTNSTYFIDQNVVSGNRYTYTVRSVASDGSYPGDYNRSGISFTHTYNYDTYVANAPANITRDMVEEKAKALGLDNNEVMGLVAWVQGEGYTNIGAPYMDYLAACVVVNGLMDGVYSRGEDFIKQIETWGGSYFSAENLKRRYENPSQGTLLAVYLALTNRQPGIYYCRGALEKPDGCFYDSGLQVQGEYSYVW